MRRFDHDPRDRVRIEKQRTPLHEKDRILSIPYFSAFSRAHGRPDTTRHSTEF
jgi:hypothetical protein